MAIRGLEQDFDIPGFDAKILQNLLLDTDTVTDQALDDYGVLPDAAVNDRPPARRQGAGDMPELRP